MEIFSTDQVAKILRVSARRVRALLKAGRLPGRQIGREWIILGNDLRRFRPWPNGRPKKC